jgi:hypothetical protein
MSWHPKKNELAVADMAGYWAIVSGLGGGAKSEPKAAAKVDEDEEMLDDEEVGRLL